MWHKFGSSAKLSSKICINIVRARNGITILYKVLLYLEALLSFLEIHEIPSVCIQRGE